MTHLRWIIGILISGVAVYVAFAGVDWPDVADALGEANYWLLAGALPVLFAFIVMRAERWRLLFHPDTHIRLRSTFGALNIGYMAGAILPLQLGELARVYVLSEAEKLRTARVLSTVAVERLLDVYALLGILAVLIPFVGLPRAAAITAAVLLAIFLAFGLVVLIAAIDRPRVERWLHHLARRLPARLRDSALHFGHALLDGLSALASPRVVLYVVFWTVVSWMTSSLVVYLVLRAFSLDVPFAAAPFLLIATTFGFFVPSSPGAIGVYHAISIRTLTSVFDVAHEPATSYALVVHALYLIPPALLGAFFFWWHHLSLRTLQSLEQGKLPDETTYEFQMAPDAEPPPTG
jgi:hypothetical protein